MSDAGTTAAACARRADEFGLTDVVNRSALEVVERHDPAARTMKEWALEHAQRGWQVVPLRPNSKQCVLKGWPELATTDRDEIETWWSESPDANIGVVCGQGSNLCVMDFDTKDAYDEIERLYGLLPPSVWVETARGYHLYFSYRDGVKTTTSKFADQVDTKSDHGYVVAAGSVIDGYTYEFVPGTEDIPLAVPPEWMIRPASSSVPMVWHSETRPLVVESDDRQAFDILRDRIEQVRNATNGTRNNTLNTAALWAGRLVGAGRLDRTHAEDQLLAAATEAGLPEDEARATIRSGLDAGSRDPLGRRSLSSQTSSPRRSVVAEPARIKWATTIEPTETKLLWGNRLAPGELNLLAGDGGIGKSTLAQVIAQAWTDGVALPDSHDEPISRGKALFACYEDSDGLVRARGNVLGLDPHRYGVIEGSRDREGNPIPFGPDDVSTIRQAVEQDSEIRLLVIDPWAEFLGDDLNHEAPVRQALTPLAQLAHDTGLTVLIVCHINKNLDAGSARDRISGSKGLTNRVRSVLFAAPADPDTPNIVSVAHIKSNYARLAPTLSYEWKDLPEGQGWFNGHCPFGWREGTTRTSGDDLVRTRRRSKLQEAQDWLRTTLADGPIPAKEGEALAAEEGITPATLRKARESTAISFQENREWLWKLR